jgi:hypothetical protein
MKSLAERHADRAARIVANGSETGGTPAASIGTVALMFSDFYTARAKLNEDDKAELDASLKTISEEIDAGTTSLAEAPDGSGRTMAGVGVINTKVVPAGVDAPEAGNGGGTDVGSVDGWGANASPAATVKTSDTNLGGDALQEQGAGADTKAAKAAKTPAEAPKA